ncbi:TonB-dependent receptor [Saccharicrinis aurantiacus]|uniref:TonB-dependent receptor n=1 Tax=Saccharicrinis aurantiacus TaxID=1849719 RepID=UPI00094F79CE|nr:TonB-dependent receptor [Saccharicrinis aurantiacus]
MKTNLLSILFLLMGTYAFSQTKNFTISGYITDAGSGEKLINANIYDPNTYKGAVSNVYGFYSLSLPEGDYKIVYSYVGFENKIVEINLKEDQVLNMALDYTKSIDEVTVVGGAVTNKLEDSQMSKEVLTMEMVKSMPAFMGEADVMKALQLLPGVQSGSESTSGLYVRGGGPDQNLILLDGVPVYNANHLFGFFSVFNPDAIKNVSLYKAGFPARFGGRLSSVVDIRMKEGNEKEFHGGVQVGLVSSKFHLEGPIKKDKTAFHVSARRTYVDALMRPFMNEEDGVVGYYFYDLNAKVNHKFSEKDRLYLSAYAGRDKASSAWNDDYEYDQNGYRYKDESKLLWGNITTALRWNHVFNNKLFSNTTVTYSEYNFNVQSESQTYKYDIKTDDVFYKYKSGIDDMSAKIEFDWYPNYTNNIKFGLNYIYHTFTPGVEVFRASGDYDNIDQSTGDDPTNAQEINTFIEDDIILTDKLKANVGLHYSMFSVDNSFYSSIEPRLSMRYMATDKLTFKVAYSKMQQYLHLLSNSTIGLPTDLWLPVTDKVKPQISHQVAGGVVYNIFPGYTFSTEGFYKEMQNIIEYKEGASFFGSSINWEEKVESGDGKAYGVEFLLKKERGKSTGWLGYTWSRSERLFDNLNNGEWFPARYDRTHDISAVYSCKVSDKFDFGATWVFGTGNAVTLPTHYIQPLPSSNGYSDLPYFENRNNYRMPNYHRLDIGCNFHKKKKNGTRTWNLSIYNLYNRQNPFYLYHDGFSLKQVSLFPILPSVSYTFNF